MLSTNDLTLLTRIVKVMRKKRTEIITTTDFSDVYRTEKKTLGEKLARLASLGVVSLENNEIKITECGWLLYGDKEIRKQKWLIAVVIKYDRRKNAIMKQLGFQKLVRRVYIAPFSQKRYLQLKNDTSVMLIIGTATELKLYYRENPLVEAEELIEKARRIISKIKQDLEKLAPENKYAAFKKTENCITALKWAVKALYIYNEDSMIDFDDSLDFAVEYISAFFPEHSRSLSEVKDLYHGDVTLLTAYKVWNITSRIVEDISKIVGEDIPIESD